MLAEVGHQIGTLDLAHPCLGESPSDLAVAIEIYGRKRATDPAVALQKSAAERDRAAERIRSRLPPKKRKMFDRILLRLHRYETVLDNTSFEMQRGWPLFRRIFLELGARLCRQGALETPADIFFLAYDDVADGFAGGTVRLTDKARNNREIWRRQHDLDAPRCIPAPGDPSWDKAVTWPIDLRALCGQEGRQDWTLRGIAASPGQRTGRARVCLTLDDAARLEIGEILIAPRTTPNWTPLFSQAAAIVTDVGAATSHSSIIAREFRIPAVVGTQLATRVVKSGDQITVDGTTGLVHLQLQTL
jgi:pyruvate,water dikinase